MLTTCKKLTNIHSTLTLTADKEYIDSLSVLDKNYGHNRFIDVETSAIATETLTNTVHSTSVGTFLRLFTSNPSLSVSFQTQQRNSLVQQIHTSVSTNRKRNFVCGYGKTD